MLDFHHFSSYIQLSFKVSNKTPVMWQKKDITTCPLRAHATSVGDRLEQCMILIQVSQAHVESRRGNGLLFFIFLHFLNMFFVFLPDSDSRRTILQHKQMNGDRGSDPSVRLVTCPVLFLPSKRTIICVSFFRTKRKNEVSVAIAKKSLSQLQRDGFSLKS